jgi:phage shock protein A
MVFFSRLTDIVTCNLHSLLDGTDEPLGAIEGVLAEIEQGLAGAKRSVMAASNAVIRLEEEIETHRKGIASWADKARAAVQSGQDDAARVALLRKREVGDLVAGLEQQLTASLATRDHLQTTLRAIEARRAEAQRLATQRRTGRLVWIGNHSRRGHRSRTRSASSRNRGVVPRLANHARLQSSGNRRRLVPSKQSTAGASRSPHGTPTASRYYFKTLSIVSRSTRAEACRAIRSFGHSSIS